MKKIGIVLATLVSLNAVQSYAATYKCQKNGHIVFSDHVEENCEVIQVKPVSPSEDEMARAQANRQRRAQEDQKQQEAATAEQAKAAAARRQQQEQSRMQRELETAREAAKPVWYGTQLDYNPPTAPSGYRLPDQTDQNPPAENPPPVESNR